MHIKHSTKTFLVTTNTSALFTVEYEHQHLSLPYSARANAAVCQTPLPALHFLALVSKASLGQENISLQCLNEYASTNVPKNLTFRVYLLTVIVILTV